MTDGDRLRDLQRKAYAPGGSLTDAEAAELRALTAAPGAVGGISGAAEVTRDSPAAAAPGTEDAGFAATDEASPGSESGPAVSGPAASGTVASGTVASATVASGSDASVSAASGPVASVPDARPHRGWSVLVSAAAVALLLGVGVGWFLFGRPSTPASMSADDAAVQDIFEKTGEYDPGSLRFAGSKDGASVWLATKDDGRQACLAIRVGDDRAAQCTPAEVDSSQLGEVTVNVDTSIDGERWMYWAVVVESIEGESTVLLQRTNTVDTTDWRDQYRPEQLPLAGAIIATGVDPYQISIVGFDGELPVWLSVDVPRCLYVVDPDTSSVTKACEDGPDGLQLSIGDTTYRVSNGGYSDTLTIERKARGTDDE